MRPSALHAFRLILVATLATVDMGAETLSMRELRVCADPDNLPFSNEKREGFENKLVDLIAADRGATVKYTWLRQRRGFLRRGLNAKACDLVVGLPSASEMALTTQPYYRSTYVFVYRKREDLRLQSFDHPALRQLKIGLHAVGEDGANPPPAHALARRGIVKNVFGFRMWDVDSVENPQGEIINAVAKGDIDVAIVWGPLGGYFAKRQKEPLEIMPVSPSIEPSGMPFVFEIAMGVRSGDTTLKAELDEILKRRRRDIDNILDQYGVPRVDQGGTER
jgi:mxaJ protein